MQLQHQDLWHFHELRPSISVLLFVTFFAEPLVGFNHPFDIQIVFKSFLHRAVVYSFKLIFDRQAQIIELVLSPTFILAACALCKVGVVALIQLINHTVGPILLESQFYGIEKLMAKLLNIMLFHSFMIVPLERPSELLCTRTLEVIFGGTLPPFHLIVLIIHLTLNYLERGKKFLKLV